MNIAHLSDIHFFVPIFGIKQFFSKRWIGNFNALLNRRKKFITNQLDQLIQSLKDQKTNLVIITGDFTSTANRKEFILAKQFIQKIKNIGITIFVIPGNHDIYTKEAFRKKVFDQYLLQKESFNHGVIFFENIINDWDLILLNTTILNRAFYANGYYSKTIEEELKKSINPKKNLIIANHFPLSDSKKKHRLIHGGKLKALLKKHPKTVIYLHGHTHKTSYKKEENLHILNSSETTVINKFFYQTFTLENPIKVNKICYDKR